MFASQCTKVSNIGPELKMSGVAPMSHNDNGWQDLTLPVSLPETQVTALHSIAKCMSNGRGISPWGMLVVFTGCDAAGKLMAAEALAYELQRPLHRVDGNEMLTLSDREAQKQLARTIKAAGEERAILMIDTTAGLPNALLHTLRSYPGLSILTMDSARNASARLVLAHYAVDFPFPFDNE
jgi:hypothetical protein